MCMQNGPNASRTHVRRLLNPNCNSLCNPMTLSAWTSHAWPCLTAVARCNKISISRSLGWRLPKRGRTCPVHERGYLPKERQPVYLVLLATHILG